MNRTKIEWCDSTWNPVTGCRHGCPYCYAERITRRFGKPLPDRSGYPEHHGGCHIIENKIKGNPYPYLFEPTFHPYRLDEPSRYKEPKTIFVCSMADLFGEWVPEEWMEEVFRAAKNAPQHRYIFLTKNPGRLCELAKTKRLPSQDNWWYGTTVTNEDQLIYPGRFLDHIFVSIEPLLNRLDVGLGSFGGAEWIIIGAETGNREGKVTPKKAWVDNICKTAALTHIPVYMKDSLLPIMGQENMRREFPWEQEGKYDSN